MLVDPHITRLVAISYDRRATIAQRGAAFTAAIQIVYERITGTRLR